MDKKICIKYKDFDLLRIIPFPENQDYGFKISFLDNEYQLRIHQIDSDSYHIPGANFEIKDCEITYHNKNDQSPAKLHLKQNENDYHKYSDLPFDSVAEPNTNTYFPIPFLKLEVSSEDIFRSFKCNSDHSVIHMGDNNVLELYLTNPSFDVFDFDDQWDIFSLIYTIVPMEFFVTGKLDYPWFRPKYHAIYNKPTFRASKFSALNNKIGCLAISYNKNLETNPSNITFYENGDYLYFLLNAPTCYFYDNKQASETLPAFIRQLQRVKRQMREPDYNFWQYYLTTYRKATKSKNHKITGLAIEAVNKNVFNENSNFK